MATNYRYGASCSPAVSCSLVLIKSSQTDSVGNIRGHAPTEVLLWFVIAVIAIMLGIIGNKRWGRVVAAIVLVLVTIGVAANMVRLGIHEHLLTTRSFGVLVPVMAVNIACALALWRRENGAPKDVRVHKAP